MQQPYCIQIWIGKNVNWRGGGWHYSLCYVVFSKQIKTKDQILGHSKYISVYLACTSIHCNNCIVNVKGGDFSDRFVLLSLSVN